MCKKQNIIIVGDYSRNDFLLLFDSIKDSFNFFFIEFASKVEVSNSNYLNYGEAIFWKDYNNAFSLLKELNPVKVIFFYIESFNHVALNIACKEYGIETYLIDHGLRDIAAEKAISQTINLKVEGRKFKDRLKKFNLNSISKSILTRLFFIRTLIKANEKNKTFLKHYFNIRSKHTQAETFELIKSELRLPNQYIVFNRINFEARKNEDHLLDDLKVKFIGIPYFDKWHNLTPQQHEGLNILLITQPFTEQGLCGWTKDFECEFIKEISSVINKLGFNLYVKSHPYESPIKWAAASHEYNFKLLNNDELFDMVPKLDVILGFSSTLLIPLVAMPHTVTFTLENHPGKELFLSKFLVDAGVSFPIYSFHQLADCLFNLGTYKNGQKNNKDTFIKEWMYKFDGKAAQRLKDVILSN